MTAKDESASDVDAAIDGLYQAPLDQFSKQGLQRTPQARLRACSGASHFRSSPAAYGRHASPQRARSQPARRPGAPGPSQQPRATRTSIPSGCARSWETSDSKGEKVGEIAAKAVVQLLFSTGKSFTVDGLREKLREFFRQEVRAEQRAVAALNNVELITALISFNWQLALAGLQLRILNGVVSLLTTEVHKGASRIFKRTKWGERES
jgi:hypothetical protein